MKRGGRIRLVGQSPVGVAHIQNGGMIRLDPIVRQNRVGARQLEQGHLSAAEGEREIVFVGVAERGDAEALGEVDGVRDADLLEG